MSARATLAVIAAVAVFAVPQPASARPAVVRLFEAKVRAGPSPDAPIVHQLPEGTAVSVSEDARDGWRRVRLPDGRTGWIEDAAVTLGAPLDVSPPPVSAPPSPPPPPPPDLRPRLVVEDAGQLPRLMQKDPKFAADAQSLADRRKVSFAAGAVGLLGSIAFTIAGANNMDGPPPGDPRFGQTPDGPKYFLAGVVTLAVGGLVAVLAYPKRAEVVDLVNGWNIAHPDKPLEVQPIIERVIVAPAQL